MRLPRFRWPSFPFFLLLLACSSKPQDSWHTDPADVTIVNDDVSRFWAAYDELSRQEGSDARVATLQARYLDSASPTLKSFSQTFGITAQSLLNVVVEHEPFYNHVRDASLAFPSNADELRIRQVLADWETLYPQAHFPDIYAVIGDTYTAGTVLSSGLVIGAETIARAAADLDSSTPSHLIKLELSIDALPEILAHEVAHAQQPYFSGRQTELFWIIIEGSADFLAELVTGRLVSPDRMEYGNAHEAELWASLKQTQDNLGKGSWFREGQGENPGGLGYYMGYQITKSYYERQRDPKQAVHDILNIADFALFLEESGYASKFE